MEKGCGRNKGMVGQGMVEFALVAPIIFLLLWGIIEVAHLFFVYNTVAIASREASRYGASVDHWNDCQGIRNAAESLGRLAGIDDSHITIQIDTGPNDLNPQTVCNGNNNTLASVQNGDRVTVTVIGSYQPFVPIAEFKPLPLSSTSSHTILMNIHVGEN